jgi:hypothetical protein
MVKFRTSQSKAQTKAPTEETAPTNPYGEKVGSIFGKIGKSGKLFFSVVLNQGDEFAWSTLWADGNGAVELSSNYLQHFDPTEQSVRVLTGTVSNPQARESKFPNTGALWAAKSDNPKSPVLTGSLNIDGTDYQLSLWAVDEIVEEIPRIRQVLQDEQTDRGKKPIISLSVAQ